MADGTRAGGIYYEIDADTSGLDAAQKRVENSSDDIARSMKGAETASKSLEGQQKKLSLAVDNTGKGMAGFGRRAGAAGIQLQQFVGQVQGGQSVMLAMSQQAADLGIVMGAPLIGAIVGIAASFAGPFVSALMGANDEMEEFKGRMDDVARSVTQIKIRELSADIELQKKAVDNAKSALSAWAGVNSQVDKQLAAQQTYNDQVLILGELERRLQELKDEQADTKGSKAQQDALENLTRSLQMQADQIGKTKAEIIDLQRAETLRRATAVGATAADIALINTIFDKIKAYELEQEALRATTKAQQEAARQEQDMARISGQYDRVKASLDAQYGAYLQFHQNVAAIQAAFDAGIIKSTAERDAQVLASGQKLNEDLRQAYIQSATGIEKVMLNAYDRVDDVGADAFTNTLTATHDMGQAVQSLASAIGRELVSSLIRYAAQWAIQQALQISGLAALTAAATPAATAVTVASAGTNIPPATAGMAAAATAGQAAFAGRATGGNVAKGNLYKVNEHNIGEMFTDPMGGQYFMPASNGTIGTGGGGNNLAIQFNISNEVQGAQFNVTNTTQTDAGYIIEATINAVAGDIRSAAGPVSKAMKGAGVQFKVN